MSNELAVLLEKKLSEYYSSIIEPTANIGNFETISKIKYYCDWLDSLAINVVMVFCSPSLDLVCLCYALVLKNKTYIPIHTSTSPELLSSYLNTLAVDLLIVDEKLSKNFADGFKNKLSKEASSSFLYYRIDNIKNSFCMLPGLVFLTSGTTELPKAVHYNYEVLSHYLRWCVQEFNFTGHDGLLFTTELSFIASLRPLFIPFLTGANLFFLAPGDDKINSFLSGFKQKQLSILNITPSLFKILID